MDSAPLLSFNYDRRFGVEIELNSFDRRDFKVHPLARGERPRGIEYIANLIMENLHMPVKICGWHYTSNNYEEWIVKPDSSCGIEICSPADKGWRGLKNILRVIDLLNKDKKIIIDNRCSFHVHIEVKDCVQREKVPVGGLRRSLENSLALAAILAYWVKCESVFLDSVPRRRKRTEYCRAVALGDMFQHDSMVDPRTLISKLGRSKYLTANTFHLTKGRRDTIEFRIIEREGCLDSHLAKNWIRLLIHFVEMTKDLSLPSEYEPGNPWSGYLWLDPKDVMRLLGFIDCPLSPGMRETRNWFLARLQKNINSNLPGMRSREARMAAKQEIKQVISELGLGNTNRFLYPIRDTYR